MSAPTSAERGGDSPPAPIASLPRVSIGVPVYNGERFLRTALTSLLAQTYRNLEIVISDNASTDGTEAICREFVAADPRVRYSRASRNRGLVWNHRRALAMARGTFFMFAPHDDWFAPGYVERCVSVLESHPEVAYVHAETILVDEEGSEIGHEIARQRLADPSPSTRFWDILVVQGGVNWYGMTRRELFHRIGHYKPLPRGERIVLAELALWGPFHLLDGELYYRRIHPHQLTALRIDRRAETLALDPSKSGGLRNSIPVLLAEYVLAYGLAVTRAPLSLLERLRGYGRIARWVLAHVPRLGLRDERTYRLDIRRTGKGDLPTGREAVGY